MRKIFLFVLAITIMWPCRFVLANNAQQAAVSHFVEAENDYKQGSFSDAIKAYESILQSGFEDGAVYFNLGNAYYKAGQFGKAVLEYERAKAFIPRDSDLNFNLKMALKAAGNSTDNLPQAWWQKVIDEHINFYTRNEMVLVMVISLFLAGVFHLLSMVLRFPISLRNLIITFCVTVFIIFTAGFIFKLQYEDGLAIMTTNASDSNEPTVNSTVHYELLQGSKVRLIKIEDNWAKIGRMDGRLGWVSAEKLEKIN